MILGLPLYIEEAQRILGIREDQDVNHYLQYMESSLVFRWYDKGVHVLGIPIEDTHISEGKYVPLNNALQKILEANNRFLYEVKRLRILLTNVRIAVMESEDILVERVEPYLID